eukprot:UN00152
MPRRDTRFEFRYVPGGRSLQVLLPTEPHAAAICEVHHVPSPKVCVHFRRMRLC